MALGLKPAITFRPCFAQLAFTFSLWRSAWTGICFLNNAAIATEVRQQKYPRIAILDIDLHYGYGTQELFYARDDVLTVSIHANRLRFYPFFWGDANEYGFDRSEGYNLNLPLPRGSGALQLPTLIVQEGGYLCAELGDNLSAFLKGFEQA